MGWWDKAWAAVLADFGDLGDPALTAQVVVRLLLAALLGAMLGWDREKKGKAAGLRTHMLVCVGSALFVLPFQQGGDADTVSRVVQGIVAGIGFLGAGTIIKGRDAEDVHGLTTAASVWFTAAIGVAAGLGREATALTSAVMAFAVLSLLPRVVPDADGPATAAPSDAESLR